MTLDEIASLVGARTGAEILAYENNEEDLLVTVLWKYSKLARDPIDQILYDNLEVQFRDLKLVYRRLPNEMKKMVMVHRSTEC